METTNVKLVNSKLKYRPLESSGHTTASRWKYGSVIVAHSQKWVIKSVKAGGMGDFKSLKAGG